MKHAALGSSSCSLPEPIRHLHGEANQKTPVLSVVRRNELSKNNRALGGWVRWRKDQMCGKAEAAVNPESACKSRQRCVYVRECDF